MRSFMSISLEEVQVAYKNEDGWKVLFAQD